MPAAAGPLAPPPGTVMPQVLEMNVRSSRESPAVSDGHATNCRVRKLRQLALQEA